MTTPIITIGHPANFYVAIIANGRKVLNCVGYNVLTKELEYRGNRLLYSTKDLRTASNLGVTHKAIIDNSHVEFIDYSGK